MSKEPSALERYCMIEQARGETSPRTSFLRMPTGIEGSFSPFLKAWQRVKGWRVA